MKFTNSEKRKPQRAQRSHAKAAKKYAEIWKNEFCVLYVFFSLRALREIF